MFDNEAHQIGVADIKRVIDYTNLPVIIKGIQTPEDALLAINAGAGNLGLIMVAATKWWSRIT